MSLNEIIKKGRSVRLTDAIVIIGIFLFCGMFIKVFFIASGVSLEEYAKYELGYSLLGGLCGLAISSTLIMRYRIAKRNEYKRGSM